MLISYPPYWDFAWFELIQVLCMIYNGCEFIGASAMWIQKTVSLKLSTDPDLQSFFSLFPLLLWFLSLEGEVIECKSKKRKVALSILFSAYWPVEGCLCQVPFTMRRKFSHKGSEMHWCEHSCWEDSCCSVFLGTSEVATSKAIRMDYLSSTLHINCFRVGITWK